MDTSLEMMKLGTPASITEEIRCRMCKLFANLRMLSLTGADIIVVKLWLMLQD